MTTGAPPIPLTVPRKTVARPTRRGGLVVALIALAVGVLGLAPVTVLAIRRNAIAEQANPAVTLHLSAGNLRFAPAEIHVPAGSVIRVDFSDDDPTSPHDFQTFGQLADTRVVAWPGENRAVYFKSAAQPGRYPFICTLRGHADAGMTGVIVVE
jgi:uncharacterized cupredoxin-like copper-binding protein